jgi:hypothetical protein
MAVSPVSNSPSPTPPRRTEQVSKPDPQQARAQNPDLAPKTEKAHEPRPAPVVNIRGEVTGRILNTSA